MRLAYLALACSIAFAPTAAQAATGMCDDDSGNIAVAITTNDQGRLLDLALTINDDKIVRFPEANATRVELPPHRYVFAAKKSAAHDALELDIRGKNGKMKYRGKALALECEWG